MRFKVAVAVILCAAPLAAQEPACDDPQTQTAMNICAYAAWQDADVSLNGAYRIAIAKARQMDSETATFNMPRRAGSEETAGLTTEEALRRAQRAWVTFRDHACLVDSDIAYGGSLQPLLFSSCAQALTETRTEQLLTFAEFE